MIPIRGLDPVDVANAKARAELEPELVVHRVAVCLVEAADRPIGVTGEEGAGLADGVHVLELPPEVEREGRHVANHRPVLVDLSPTAVHKAAVAVSE